jgi:uncharacterized protein (TIGR00251 family)
MSLASKINQRTIIQLNGGCLIKVKVKPNSNKSTIYFSNESEICVEVKSPNIEGKANRELLNLLTKILQVNKESITILRGVKSKVKWIKIDGITPQKILTYLKDVHGINKIEYTKKE